jgi:hypothetical protein
MSDEQFQKLCNTFGFAPSRALREMLDAATRQAVLEEREECATVCDEMHCNPSAEPDECAAAIRSKT